MAEIKIEEVIDYLDYDMKYALEQTMKKHFPNATFSKEEVFKTFKAEVYRKCNTWEKIPDKLIKQ
ncbi:hypothetical protein BWI97_27075 [Siphonobacter sp. BAB-5405]|uniref:hypothetical protein n=1 Tax=Siphonobacter sp. BAB-5405 TaxID=1864825 RepID=UPI000C801BE9|nr:hypothetical protein [Siphonobacter sp. BAB-5405]PMD83726.1 hypothetical protein BWI97_27075 [Siphonobacter sp. BAB-5405]